MKFDYEGKTYVLEFERNYRQLTLVRGNKKVSVRSTYPYTTATLFVLTSPTTRSIVAWDSVGCCPSDNYSNASGRLFALRGLTAKLKKRDWSREFRAALWKCYTNRDKKPAVEGEVVKETVH